MALDPAWLVCLSLCMAMGIALLGVVRWFRKLDRKREDDEEALERKRESEEEALAKAWKELEECKKIVDEEAAKGAKELDEASKALDALFEEERLKVEILKAQLEERKREVEDRLQEVARKEETMARKEEALRGEAASNVERRLAFEDERLKWEKERRLALEEEQVVVDGVTERLRKKLEEEESRYKVLMEEAQRKAQEYMRGLEEEGAKRVAEAKATEEALDERLKGLRSEVDLWSERYRIWTGLKAEEERVKESVDAAKCLVMDVKVVRALKTLYGVCEELDDPTPIYKAIYGAYVAKAMNAMVIREGVDGVCGIYRLRNKISGLSYVGQSVNIGNRWKEHAKRGSGADGWTASGSKLYAAMMKDGVWNFEWEIVEIVEDRKLLNERESWWIESMGTKENGYNSKGGNKG